jgi:Na+/H+ antiporter
MIHSIEVILVLLCTVVALELAARRVALPSPFLLLPAGILLGFIPDFPHLTLDPDLVLYVFLPPLVYAGAALGSWVEFRKNVRPITLMSIGCVLFTTVCVGWVAHSIIPAFGWAAAFVLGAVVSPPDEVAAISIARRLSLPKGISAILEGEGLINDAPALTIYRFAAAAIVTGSLSFMKATTSFTGIVVGEVIWGLFVGWVVMRARRALRNPSLEILASLLTPFIAYLPAEQLGGSGVLATVTAGLYVSYAHSQWVEATTRLQLVPLWQIIEFVMDGILFLVAGMQLHAILEPLSRTQNRLLWEYGLSITAVVIVARIVWVFGMGKLLKRAGVPLRRGEKDPRWKRYFIVSWSGMRGAISLAAALSIPLVTSTGQPFPGRDLIIFLTFCVIVGTLLAQGLSLPWLIRHFGVDREGRRERAEAGHREIEARHRSAEAALALLKERQEEGAYPQALIDRLSEQYRERRAQFEAHLAGDHDGATQREAHRFNVQTELIETERNVMLDLRRDGVIDDDILRRIEKDLDLQEMRLRQGIAEYELSPDEQDG